jgi:hypothetical protein
LHRSRCELYSFSLRKSAPIALGAVSWSAGLYFKEAGLQPKLVVIHAA